MAMSFLLSKVIQSQVQDVELISIRDQVQSGTTDEGWAIHTDGSLRYRGRVVVPQSKDLSEEILSEHDLLCIQVARRCIMTFVASITGVG